MWEKWLEKLLSAFIQISIQHAEACTTNKDAKRKANAIQAMHMVQAGIAKKIWVALDQAFLLGFNPSYGDIQLSVKNKGK